MDSLPLKVSQETDIELINITWNFLIMNPLVHAV